jgi:diguanylate cyclase (GGDEF)-like protein/PAS domain S-box-containing protein
LDSTTYGGIAIFAHEADFYTDDEVRLLSDLADDLTHALAAIEQDSRRRAAEADLRLAAQVFENSSEGIMITDAANRIVMVNKAFTEVTGYAREEVLGENPRLLNSGKQEASFYKEMWADIQRRGEWHGEVQNRRKSGEFYSEWLTISAVKDSDGAISNYVAVFTDITSTKQVEERLNFLANYDTLTSLPNRVLFSDRLEQALATARVGSKSVALLFLDLDRFNLINETFGHSAGDLVLKEIATRLKANVRKGDSVSRMGGDEFSVVMPELDRPDEAAVIAANIMHALGEPLQFDNRELFISASIGISVFPDDGDDAEALVKNADSAMYRAMEEGRNTFCFYHQEMNARSSERMSLEGELRKALSRGELIMHYQPFIDARTGRIVGAEALLRWKRPGIGYITPAAFIPLLEETGLIVPVGEWVLETACRDNKLWRQHGHPDLFVAVNFSALQLVDEQITRKVGDTLSRLDFNPRHLEIELTESMVMKDAERGIRTLREFRELGTLLSVDDFGTGYSSLSYLKRLPIDTLKIDRSFVMDTPAENEANAIVQAIIALGHSLDLKIIAEGVQEAEQVDFLRQVRCDLLQGFYFSTAVEHHEFLRMLDPREQHWHGADWASMPARRLTPVSSTG